jgi:hypothetical protein
MTKFALIVLLPIVVLGCVRSMRPETPRLRAAYKLLALACNETTDGAEGDEVLLKTWLGVRSRYPYETNLLRAIAESTPDADGMYYGDLTISEGSPITACRRRADRIAGIEP